MNLELSDGDSILETKYSSLNSRSKYVRVDYENTDGELIRIRVPYKRLRTPNGEKIELQFDEVEVTGTNISKKSIDKEQIPDEIIEEIIRLRGSVSY